MASHRIFSMLLLLLPFGTGNVLNETSLKEFISRNQCLCKCEPREQKFYFVSLDLASNWFDAVVNCLSNEMQMAEILNDGDEENLKHNLGRRNNLYSDLFWIGANDMAGNNDTYRWAFTGRTVRYGRWTEGNTNSTQYNTTAEPCVAVHRQTMMWHNISCSRRLPYLCQIFRDN